jgi:hypothetical protein
LKGKIDYLGSSNGQMDSKGRTESRKGALKKPGGEISWLIDALTVY